MKLSYPELLLTSAALAAAGCTHGGAAVSPGAADPAVGARRVLEGRLLYDGSAPANPPGPLADGELVGSGGGEVSGAMKGSLRWSLYERREAESVAQAARCTMYFVGAIRTDDGDTIPFEGRGFAVSQKATWSVGGAFAFQPPNSEKYAWLHRKALTWLGEFDPQAGSSHYAIYELSKTPERDE
jgi:hypothetical protein